MLERHIQQAQAATVIADERQLEVRQNMPDLGLPPGKLVNVKICAEICSFYTFLLLKQKDRILEDILILIY